MPSIYVTRFFQLVTARRFAQAERVLLRLRQKISRTEWNTGYFQALRGMLLAQKTNDDRYVFLSNANFKNHNELQKYRREFLRQARNKLHADYDRGYFAAWASYMRVLAKLEFATEKTESKISKKKEGKTRVRPEKKVPEKAKERAEIAKRKEEAKKTIVEPAKSRIEPTESDEEIERRQRTLFEFSK